MIIFKKTRRNTDIKNVSNHDAQARKANNKSHQKDLIKDLEVKKHTSDIYVDDTFLIL